MARPARTAFGRGALVVCGAALLWAAGPAAGAQSYMRPSAPLPVEAIARYEQLTSVAISPDGRHIAGLVSVEGEKWPVISIWDAADLSKKPVWIPSKTNRITWVDFFSPDKVVFLMEQPITGGDGKPTFLTKLYYADIEGRKIEEPFRLTGTLNKEVRDALERGSSAGVFNDNLYDSSKKLMATVDPVSFVQKIFELDLATGKTRTVALGSEEFEYLPSGVDLKTAEPLIKAKVDMSGGEFWYMVYIKDARGDWVYHEPLSYMLRQRKDITILGYDSDPSKLIVRSNAASDKSAIYSYDIAKKAFSSEPLFANDKYDISGVIFRHDREAKVSTITGIRVAGPTIVSIYTDETWAAVQKSVQAAFPGKSVGFDINSYSRETAVVTVQAADMPPQYYLYRDGKLQSLGGERPWIDPKELGKPEFVTFKARDGLDIPAFITYPPGWTQAQGAVPLIVLPHGGPWDRDYADWDGSGWPQFFATRGIAVIQPQYRGSEGWGAKLWLAGDGEWGRKMSDDNDDAAAYMVSRGVADPKRVALMGYSYGGFAAIAASVRPNSPYRCAISGAGVSSLQRIGNLWGDSHLQRDVQGVTVEGMDPIRNVDKANIPILLYHGDHDRRADTEHSRIFFNAMKAAGKDVEYREIKGMWHTLPWRTEWHRETLTLMEGYLKSPKCGLLE